MGAWYWIGAALGVGVAFGVLASGLLGALRAGLVVAALVAAASGALVGYGLEGWSGLIAGAAGGAIGAGSAAGVARGTLARGGTRVGTGIFFALAALALAALAFVPVVGYVEALAVPALAARLRRRSPERYAGLRILARD